MRKFFVGLGVVFALLIVAGGIGIFVLVRNGAALDSASKAYTEQSVEAIARDWNGSELWKRASPALRRIASPAQIDRLFASAKQSLGPLVTYGGSQGQTMMSYLNAHATVAARYVAHGHFAHGDADLQISLIKVDGEWMIQGFHINSPALLHRAANMDS
jgi:hypothetical protein